MTKIMLMMIQTTMMMMEKIVNCRPAVKKLVRK